MTERVEKSGLQVEASLARFLEDEALPGTTVEPQIFWDALAGMVAELGPRNRELLEIRERMQARISS
ncbi:MAG: hypothetical protein HUJ24_08275, partial [Rhodobacteraceae bacterium]|nr:hypothetical protein [Paracoccaceae bacterium]